MAEAAQIVYHRGEFVARDRARYAVEDRGVLFADGVYEVVRFDRGRPFAMQAHVDRLARSMEGIELVGVPAEPFAALSAELLERNDLTDAKVYWQVTRGPATRDFLVPDGAEPTMTLIAYPTPPIASPAEPPHGAGYIAEDCRWTRCWIKSLMLLPASLAKSAAVRAGAVEAIFARQKPTAGAPGGLGDPGAERHITEGASTNVFIVRDGELLTHPDDGWVLGGITRDTLIRIAGGLGIPVRDDRPFTEADLAAADEVFVCSTTQLTAITSIVGDQAEVVIADGRVGGITKKTYAAYHEAIFDRAL
ncbi:MAG: aminotransferase class IV [Planctomycetota bacterium]